MKTKIISLFLTLFITSFSFAQLENLTLSDIISINKSSYWDSSSTLTVPNGKFWIINDNTLNYVYVKFGTDPFTAIPTIISNNGYFILTPGMEFYIGATQSGWTQILEYEAPASFDGTLAINEQSFQKENLILFPNPTDSKLTIDSNKIFKIEVYDLNGRKLIETKGNSIDFSNLSNAVYVVKLFNEVDTVVSTYKVIKK